jgi:hypothetical protein
MSRRSFFPGAVLLIGVLAPAAGAQEPAPPMPPPAMTQEEQPGPPAPPPPPPPPSAWTDESLGPLGALIGPVWPRVSYGVTWHPSEPVHGQPTDLEIIRQDLRVSVPVWHEGPDMVALSANLRSETLNTDAVLPVSRTPLPDQFWNIGFGGAYTHQFDNGWTAGSNVRLGSASDRPFNNFDELTITSTSFLRIPVHEHDALILTLSVSNNTDFLNGIPIPGVAYLWQPTDWFRALVGFPFANVMIRPTNDLTIDLSYRFLYTFGGKVTYRFLPAWRVFAGYSSGVESYFLSESPDEHDRLFYSEQRVFAGLGWNIARRVSLDLTGGYAFDRFYTEGHNFQTNSSDRLNIDNGPYVTFGVQMRF